MSPSANSDSRWLLLANPGCRRTSLFQEALAALGRSPAEIVTWADLLNGNVSLERVVRPGDRFRIESPGRNLAVEQLLLAAGAEEPETEGDYAAISRAAVHDLPFDKGEILAPRQWYRGLVRALHLVAEQVAAAPPHIATSDPAEIAQLFDKPACQTALAATGLPIPRPLGILAGYEDLRARMRTAGIRRVFVKLAHGSSASGVVAYRAADRDRHQAMTTVESISAGEGSARLYNNRNIRTLNSEAEIASLIDSLCRHRACAEEWLPKPGLPGFLGAFDIRALSIGGRLRHVVGRCSRTPMTNLHLLNQRASSETVRAHVGESAWSALEQATTAAARRVFPRSLHIGLDITWTPGFRRLAILEANAFGDLLPGACSEGESTHEAEIRAVEEWCAAHPGVNALPC